MRSKVCSILILFHHLLRILFHLLKQLDKQSWPPIKLHTFTNDNYPKLITLHSTSRPSSPASTHHKRINMPSTQTYYTSYPQSSYPIQVPQKPGYYYPPQHTYGRVSASPPEAPESVTTSGVASYEPSAASSNYAGSASDYESTNGATSVDLLDYMGNRLNGSFDPMPLDRSLAKQAQT
jgi:hypothetical protein